MKVVCNTIIEKCAAATNLNQYDDAVEFMNKLNEKLSSSTGADDATTKLNGSSGDDANVNEEEKLTSSPSKDDQNCTDSGLESAASSWDKSVTEVKEHAFTKLEEELQQAREILKLRDEEVVRLRKIRQDVENELLELTASLFQVSWPIFSEILFRRSCIILFTLQYPRANLRFSVFRSHRRLSPINRLARNGVYK